jgi:hypothetical protein
MKSQLWLGLGLGLGFIVSVAGCGNSSDSNQAQAPAPESAAAPVPATLNPVKDPLLAPSKNSKVQSVPGLLQPTNAKARIPSIQTGRLDPFSAVPGTTPVIITNPRLAPPKVSKSPVSSTTASMPANAVAAAPVSTIPLIPIAPMAPLPSLPSVPVTGAAPLPPINIPVAPPMGASPTSLAESIQVSGVVQVSGKWSVIVKEPNSSSSRYVSVGDYLENGRVLVKKIVASGTPQPTVVLQQNGVEIRKSLG